MIGLWRGGRQYERIREACEKRFFPIRDGFALRPRTGDAPLFVTEAQRMQIITQWMNIQRRMIRITTATMIVALMGWSVFAVAEDLGDQFWPILLITIGVVMALYLLPRGAMHRAVIDAGASTGLVSDGEFRSLQQQRLRDTTWAALLLPALIVPFLLWRFNTRFPPRDTNDWSACIFAAMLTGFLIFGFVRKVRASRGA